LQVRTAHVHVILSCPCSPDNALGEIKSRCTRKLREAGLIADDCRPWSRHGSTVYIFSQSQYEAAVRYVRDEQGENLPGPAEMEKRTE